jgi:diguanylate cyclase (GGDEF)-like protein
MKDIILMKTSRDIDTDIKHRDLSILIVDDDEIVLKIIAKILELSDKRYFIATSKDVEKTLELIQKTYWDTILLDLSIPWKTGGTPDTKNGLNLLEKLKNELNLTTPVIAITGHHEDELSDYVLDKGAYYFLNKPVRPKYLSAIIKNSTHFQLSGYDGLTGLLNRTTFEERLKSEFFRTKRKNDEIRDKSDARSVYLSILYIDFDNFKQINDSYNHLIGDLVLKRISSFFTDENIFLSINGIDRESSYIIRPYDLAARVGGDEFCLFLPDADHQSALIVAKRIQDRLKKFKLRDILGPGYDKPKTDDITISIGISTFPNPNNADNHEYLIQMADRAMYTSKKNRCGDIYGYDESNQIVKFG